MAAVTTIGALVAEFLHAAGMAPAKAVVACNKAAYDTQRLAKQFAPVDTGFLRSSITVTPATAGRLEAEVGPEANYGAFLEHGTVNMPAQPYMGPAMDQVAPGFEQALTGALT